MEKELFSKDYKNNTLNEAKIVIVLVIVQVISDKLEEIIVVDLCLQLIEI